MKIKPGFFQIIIYGGLLILIALSFPLWAMKKPSGVLDNALPGNNDLLYFATDAPDNFIVWSPGLCDNRGILSASQRMSDMVISPDGTIVWTATKSGYIDRFELAVDQRLIAARSTIHRRIAPVLSSIALSANGRFIAVGWGSSEDYNSRNVKILPSDTVSLDDELADFSVSGDIQDIVANPVEDYFYIINSHSDRIRIYNADRFRLEPDIIEMGNSPGNFIVRPDGRRAYGAMNARQAIGVVDLVSNETIDYITLGFPPYAMAFNSDGSRLYIASRDSATIAVMDTATDEIQVMFDLPPRMQGLLEYNFPEMIGVSSDEKYLYVMPKRKELLVYDISRMLAPDYSGGERPQMVQSEFMANAPFFMKVIRGHAVPGVPEE
jgi:hypothetical protein